MMLGAATMLKGTKLSKSQESVWYLGAAPFSIFVPATGGFPLLGPESVDVASQCGSWGVVSIGPLTTLWVTFA